MAVRRRQMRHVLFTEPEVIEAGTQASLTRSPNHHSVIAACTLHLNGVLTCADFRCQRSATARR